MRLAGNAALVTVLNVASLFVGLLTYPVIAARFALGETDEFFLALTLPMLVVGPITNAVGSMLVPVLSDCSRNRPEALAPALGAALAWSIVVGAAGALVVGLAAPLLLAAAGAWLTMDAATRVAGLTLWLLPLVLIQSAASVLSAGANTAARYWLPAAANLAQSALALAVIGLLSARSGTTVLVAASLIAGALQLGLLWMFWPKDWARLRPSFRHSPDFARAARLAVPVLAGTFVLQAGVVATRMIAAAAGEGGVTALEYASRGAGVVMECLSSGVLVVVLTEWSRAAAAGDPSLLRRKLAEAMQMMLFLSAPVIAVVYGLRAPLVELWLPQAGGAGFHALVAAVLGFFVLGVPLDIGSRLCARYFVVTGATAILATAASLRVLATIGIALLLAGTLGVPAVSLADLCGIALTLAILGWMAFRSAGSASAWADTMRTFAAFVASWACAAMAARLCGDSVALLQVLSGTVAGTIAFLAAALALRSVQFRVVREMIGRRIGARRPDRLH